MLMRDVNRMLASKGEQKTCQNGNQLIDSLQELELGLPSTFRELRKGSDYTCCVNGAKTRVDYVIVPLGSLSSCPHTSIIPLRCAMSTRTITLLF